MTEPRDRFLRWFLLALSVTLWLAYAPSPAGADPYPPYWGGGSGGAVLVEVTQ